MVKYLQKARRITGLNLLLCFKTNVLGYNYEYEYMNLNSIRFTLYMVFIKKWIFNF